MLVVFSEVKVMIYVSVGTQKFQFDRLIKAMDVLVYDNVIKETVFIQSGNSTYKPKFCQYAPFLEKEDFEKKLSMCDLLVTHGGVATIISGLKKNKPVIVMPRLVEFGEHVDNHQMQIIDAFAEKNLVLKCNNTDELADLIYKAREHKFNKYISHHDRVITTVRNFIENMKK